MPVLAMSVSHTKEVYSRFIGYIRRQNISILIMLLGIIRIETDSRCKCELFHHVFLFLDLNLCFLYDKLSYFFTRRTAFRNMLGLRFLFNL